METDLRNHSEQEGSYRYWKASRTNEAPCKKSKKKMRDSVQFLSSKPYNMETILEDVTSSIFASDYRKKER
jgi:hypothetical protein